MHLPIQDAHPDYNAQEFLIRNINDERAGYYKHNGLMSTHHRWPRAKYSDKKSAKPIVQCLGLGRAGLQSPKQQIIVDPWALSDPFLARVPAVQDPFWDVGHLYRAIPQGYLQSVYTGNNKLVDPALQALWTDIILVSQGELWSWKRTNAIIRLQILDYGIDMEKRRTDRDHLQYEGQKITTPLMGIEWR